MNLSTSPCTEAGTYVLNKCLLNYCLINHIHPSCFHTPPFLEPCFLVIILYDASTFTCSFYLVNIHAYHSHSKTTTDNKTFTHHSGLQARFYLYQYTATGPKRLLNGKPNWHPFVHQKEKKKNFCDFILVFRIKSTSNHHRCSLSKSWKVQKVETYTP